ncbi:MAG TPA: YbhB/YbcL family Raf kinase inhibitor-like protein [Acidimicrobiales bacterium]|nr:YbhB/YbcL family Raf kinase inhibitor-like protein [Acidimicrobiales bacterium]
MRALGALVAVACSGVVALVACDTGDGREFSRPPTSDQNQSVLTTAATTAPAVPTTTTFVVAPGTGPTTAAPVVGEAQLAVQLPWPDEGVIDIGYTCEGFGVAPDVSWSGSPPEATELGLAFIDLDAQGFVHWVVTGIPAGTTSIVGGMLPPGAVSQANDFGDPGYGGPCPSEGEHRYLLTLYALAFPTGLDADASAQEAINTLEAGSIAQVSAAGRYAQGGVLDQTDGAPTDA